MKVFLYVIIFWMIMISVARSEVIVMEENIWVVTDSGDVYEPIDLDDEEPDVG